MRLRRRASALFTAGVALLVLAGCQKPVPEIGVYSSGTYVAVPATAYCFSVEQAAENDCRVNDVPPREIDVREGATVGISVPHELADLPWVVVLSVPGTNRVAERSPYQIGKTYLSLSPRFDQSPRLLAQIVAYQSDGRAVRPIGLWRFELVRQPPLQGGPAPKS